MTGCGTADTLETVGLATHQAMDVLSLSVPRANSRATARRWSTAYPAIVRPEIVAQGGPPHD